MSLEAYVAASALLLLLPMTPLLFMGQEWATSSPFLYFTDHDPALGAQIRRGRREEFKGFLAFTEAAARERIPDPQALETFDASRLNWEERDEPTHHGTLELYRELLALRRTDPVLSRATRQNLRVEARGDVLLVRIEGAFGVRLLLVNFGKRPVSLQELGVAEDRWQKMLSTRDSPHGLASECALLLSPSPAV